MKPVVIKAIRIAIADDHQSFRKGYISMLKTNFPKEFDFVFDVGDGNGLIEKLATVQELPDIILLDVSMPVMNGYVAMDLIHKRWPDLKVVGLSMYDDDYVVTKMLVNGACGFITKDMSLEDIYTALTTVHEKGRYFFGVSTKFATQPLNKLKEFIPNLTEKEMKFLALCPTEMNYKEMAEELGLSVRTVHSYRDILFKKFDINNRVGLAMFAIRIGLMPNTDVCQ